MIFSFSNVQNANEEPDNDENDSAEQQKISKIEPTTAEFEALAKGLQVSFEFGITTVIIFLHSAIYLECELVYADNQK